MKDKASGSSNGWAAGSQRIKYAYAIEIGPTEEELGDAEFKLGFSVNENRIGQVAKVAYYGLYQYMRSFVDSLSELAREEIRRTCLQNLDQSLLKDIHSS